MQHLLSVSVREKMGVFRVVDFLWEKKNGPLLDFLGYEYRFAIWPTIFRTKNFTDLPPGKGKTFYIGVGSIEKITASYIPPAIGGAICLPLIDIPQDVYSFSLQPYASDGYSCKVSVGPWRFPSLFVFTITYQLHVECTGKFWSQQISIFNNFTHTALSLVVL